MLRPFLAKLAPTLTLGAGVTIAMFLFTYVPQVAIMAFTEGPLAPFSAALLVLSESSTIFNFLSRSFVLGDSLVDVFDGTLVSRDCEVLVSKGRTVNKSGDAMSKLGKLVKKPFEKYSPAAFIRYFLYLPLNFIPVVGTVIFVLLQGRSYGPTSHSRYFQLKGMSSTQRQTWVDERMGAYTSFGVPAVMLEMIPFGGILFTFTNQCGAALWAADLEKKSAIAGNTAPELRAKAKKAT